MDKKLEVRQLADLIEKNRGYKLEFRLQEWETDFFRFYKSQANYNISRKDRALSCAIGKDRRVYRFEMSDPGIDGVEKALADAKLAVEKVPQDPFFADFEENPEIYDYLEWKDSIAGVPLDEKISILQSAAQAAGRRQFDIFGKFITLRNRTTLVNSNGLNKQFYQSPVMLEVKAVSRKNQATVACSYCGNDMSDFDQVRFLDGLEKKMAMAELKVTDMAPGEYEAVLAPSVMHEFCGCLAQGAKASALDEGSSFFKGKLGQKVFPESVTVASLPFHPRLIRFPYNGDGHLAKDLFIIEKGVFKNFIVSNYYAHKLKMEKNGSVGEDALVLYGGDKSLGDMLRGVKKGLYISSLHYMNFINEKETSVTGLTRDGTFLIQDGEITNIVNNLRYTVRISDILSGVTDIEDEQYTVPFCGNYGNFSISSGLFPHVRTSAFAVSSSTRTI